MTDRATIIATGPSLTREDCELAFWTMGRDVIAVNDAYRLLPGFDHLYACDFDWWELHIADVLEMPGTRWTCSELVKHSWPSPLINHVPALSKQAGNPAFATEYPITTGATSTFQALNLAYILGYRNVVLLGLDLGHDPGEPSHFFGDHPGVLRKASPFGDMIDAFNAAAPVIAELGMKVVNASRRTRLDCFPRIDLEDALYDT